MIFNHEEMPAPSVAELLEEAAARTGFSPADVEILLTCELNTDELLAYVTAVVSNRMN
jgi:hypothetical protein